MMHPDPRRIAPVVILVVVAAAAFWYLNSTKARENGGAISASGTIEATQVLVASETNGKVREVLVQEGDAIKAGEILVNFDEDLLKAQLAQAESTLAQAKASYELVAAGPTQEERQTAVTNARLEMLAAQQALEQLYDLANLSAAQTLREIALATRAIDNATDHQVNLISPADQADIDIAQAALVLARDRLDKAREDFEPYENKPEDNLIRAALLSKKAAAQDYYDTLVTRYNNLIGEANEIDLSNAEADLAVAKAQLADAQRRYNLVKDGPDPDQVSLAEARLESAKAHLDAALADPSPERLRLSQTQIDNAQAALNVLMTQLQKLVIKAPMDGIVLERLIEPGEVASLSTPLLSLARLDDLTITVYVPEDRYGEIQLGQQARVTVDSFPDEKFEALVTHIADQAEYTPRNVQTAEGRRTTVFAVKLAVDNPAGKLKPGMPADVVFDQ
jgi:HlyD family secretion protein